MYERNIHPSYNVNIYICIYFYYVTLLFKFKLILKAFMNLICNQLQNDINYFGWNINLNIQ